jgi:hypothetical protein
MTLPPSTLRNTYVIWHGLWLILWAWNIFALLQKSMRISSASHTSSVFVVSLSHAHTHLLARSWNEADSHAFNSAATVWTMISIKLLCLRLRSRCSLLMSVSVPAWLRACVPFGVSAFLSACVPVFLPVCLSACPPACLSACLSVCLSVCLFAAYVSAFLGAEAGEEGWNVGGLVRIVCYKVNTYVVNVPWNLIYTIEESIFRKTLPFLLLLHVYMTNLGWNVVLSATECGGGRHDNLW